MGLRGLLVREWRDMEWREGKGGKRLGKGEGPTSKGMGEDVKGGERGKGKGGEAKGEGERRGLCSCKNSSNTPRVVWSLNCLHVIV